MLERLKKGEDVESITVEMATLVDVVQRSTAARSPDHKVTRIEPKEKMCQCSCGRNMTTQGSETLDGLQTVEGHPLKAVDVDAVVIILGGKEQEKAFKSSLLRACPSYKKWETEEDMVEIRTTTCIRVAGKDEEETKRIFFVKTGNNGEVKREHLEEIRNRVGMERKVAMNNPDCEGAAAIRKLVVEVLQGINVTLYIKEEKKRNYADAMKKGSEGASTTMSSESHLRISNKDFPALGRIPRRKEAVIVKADEGTFAETLKKVKQTVAADGSALCIEGTRKTRNGDLIITVKDRESAVALKARIGDNDGLAPRLASRDYALEVRELEATTTTEELKQALEGQLQGNLAKEVTIKALKQGPGGTQTAIVRASSTAAIALLKKDKLRVGWAIGKIKKREEAQQCYRCWETGHWARECKGTDRSRLCLNCGTDGHEAKNCVQEAYCPICQEAGHRAKSTRCPKYKKALEEEAKGRGQNKNAK